MDTTHSINAQAYRPLPGIRATVLAPADGLASAGRFADRGQVGVVGFLDLAGPARNALPPLHAWCDGPWLHDPAAAHEAAVVLVRRYLHGGIYTHAIPWAGQARDALPGSWAASGRFIICRDSRVTAVTGHELPIPLHDYELRAERR